MDSFIETKLFSRLVVEYLTDEECTKLRRALIEDPKAGDLILGPGREYLRQIKEEIDG